MRSFCIDSVDLLLNNRVVFITLIREVNVPFEFRELVENCAYYQGGGVGYVNDTVSKKDTNVGKDISGILFASGTAAC